MLLVLPCQGSVKYIPTDGYEARYVRGWKIMVSKQLLSNDAGLAKKALEQMDHQLYQITRVVPGGPLKELRKIAIWVEHNAPEHACACYHPNRVWLSENGFNPDKERSVEIANARNFINWTISQPWMVMHELAHAYHHNVLGYDNVRIKAAYEKAVESKKYESVLHISGNSKRAYALNNDQEYFAECSEAFLGTNDFYPYVKSELEQHDPEMYKVLRDVWRK